MNNLKICRTYSCKYQKEYVINDLEKLKTFLNGSIKDCLRKATDGLKTWDKFRK